MNWLLTKAAKMAVGGKAIAAVAWLHDSLNGKRSEVVIALIAGVELAALAGVIPDDQASKLKETLYALLGVTAADRCSKIIKSVREVAGKS